MKDPQVGWIAAIIIGGVAGWLAEQFMKSQKSGINQSPRLSYRLTFILRPLKTGCGDRTDAIALAK
jgi:hypothetical protein